MKHFNFITITLLCNLIFTLLSAHAARVGASEFDELDKPPEGIHKNQFLIMGAVAMGRPYGDLILAEENFTKKTVYTFENEISKLMYLSHLSFGFSISAEYVPLDYIGVRTKFRRGIIMQNTNFGKDYQSWRKTLYSDYSMFFGPAFHITYRKPWDIAVSPLIGYTFASYHPTPIADELIAGYESPPAQHYSGLTYGVDVFLSIFFSGGLVVQIGGEWIRSPVSFSEIPDAQNPQTSQIFFNKKTAQIDSILFSISAGYALYH